MHLWAKCLSVHKEVIVIDDRPDIVLELTTTWGSCKAAIMQTRRTLTWPEPFTYITTISNHLQQTSRRNQAFRFNNKAFRSDFSQPSKMHNQSLMSFMSFFFLALPPTYFLPILLHHVFCIGHILLRLPYVIHFIRNFQFDFVFPTSSILAWAVICNWLHEMACSHAVCPYQQRRWLPDSARIIRAINYESCDIHKSVNYHAVRVVEFNPLPTYSEHLIRANERCASVHRVWLKLVYVNSRSAVGGNIFAPIVMVG
jgi:hypothetical protein